MSDTFQKITVHVVTRAKSNGVEMVGPNVVKVRTTVAPKQGAANQMVQRMLAKYYGLPPSRVILQSGEKLKKKTFIIIEK